MVSTRNVIISAASLVAVAQALTVNTPASAVQCQPVALGWGDGTAPFYVSIIPGGQPSAAALENIPTQTGTSYTWMVDIAAGTSITVKVVDSTGAVNYSDQITIQAGTTTDCAASSGGAAAAGSSSDAESTSASASSRASSSSSSASSSSALASSRAPLSASTTGGSTSARTTTGATTTSGVGANAAAASTSATGAAKMGATVGFSLLGAGLLFALAA